MSQARPARQPPLFERVAAPRPSLPAGPYARVVGVLAQYISPMMARSIVDRALGTCGIQPGCLVAEDMPRVVEQARVGLGMFCDPGRLTSLMLDLAELCNAETHPRNDDRPPL